MGIWYRCRGLGRAGQPSALNYRLSAFLQLVAEALSYSAMPSSQADLEHDVCCLPGAEL